MIQRSSSTPRDDLGLSAACGLWSWACVVGALTLVADPAISAAAFVMSVCIAWSLGRVRLIVPALASGLFMLILVPLVVALSGGAAAAIDMSTSPDLTSLAGIAMAIGTILRVPALIAASLIIICIPGPELVRFVSKLSSTGALMAAITSRFRFRLSADAAAIAEEARAAGSPLDSPRFLERSRAQLGLIEAFIASSLDRSFEAGEALESRGFGARFQSGRPRKRRVDPWSSIGASLDRRKSWTTAIGATIALCAAISIRVLGAPAPAFDIFAGADADLTALSLIAAGALCGTGVILLRSGGITTEDAVVLPDRAPRPSVKIARERSLGSRIDLESVAIRRRIDLTTVVSSIDLTVEAGQHVKLNGPSGSGKSSVLGAVGGYIPFHRPLDLTGRVLLGGRDVTADRPALRARHIASVFQESQSQSFLSTVWDEIAFSAANTPQPRRSVEQRVWAVLDQMKLSSFAGRAMWSLSSGETQTVMIACALVRDPAILVLDEPCASLDPRIAKRVRDGILSMKARGTTILSTEHQNTEGTELIPDRILAIGASSVAEREATSFAQRVISPSRWVAITEVTTARGRLTISDPSGVGLWTLGRDRRLIARHVCADLPAGSALAILGPNGAGKTTMLRAALGLIPSSDNGLYTFVDGIPIRGHSQLWKMVGWVPQRAGWGYAAPTIFETVERRIAQTGVRLSCNALLAEAGLSHVGGLHPLDLSVGERQRLGLVLATMHGPSVWVLDEPSRGMDPIASEWLRRRILRHRDDGGVVVFATHDTSLVSEVATHSLWVGTDGLRDGMTPLYRRDLAVAPATVSITSATAAEVNV